MDVATIESVDTPAFVYDERAIHRLLDYAEPLRGALPGAVRRQVLHLRPGAAGDGAAAGRLHSQLAVRGSAGPQRHRRRGIGTCHNAGVPGQ